MKYNGVWILILLLLSSCRFQNFSINPHIPQHFHGDGYVMRVHFRPKFQTFVSSPPNSIICSSERIHWIQLHIFGYARSRYNNRISQRHRLLDSAMRSRFDITTVTDCTKACGSVVICILYDAEVIRSILRMGPYMRLGIFQRGQQWTTVGLNVGCLTYV